MEGCTRACRTPRKEKGVCVCVCAWWMKKVEEQSREVACFCYERKENTAVFGKSRLSPVACMTTCPRAQANANDKQTCESEGQVASHWPHFVSLLMPDDSSSSYVLEIPTLNMVRSKVSSQWRRRSVDYNSFQQRASQWHNVVLVQRLSCTGPGGFKAGGRECRLDVRNCPWPLMPAP